MTGLILAITLALVAAGCGSDDADVDAAGTSADETATGSGSSAADDQAGDETDDAEDPAEEDTGDDAENTAGEDAEDTAGEDADTGSREVETSFGTVEVPNDPQRVLALDEYAAMSMLAVGIEPMEVVGSYSSLVSQEILTDAGVSVERTDTSELNLEAIAGARPDVIVVTAESAFMANFEPLSEIAPTVILPYIAPWRDVLADTGRIFGRDAEAANVTAALETKIAEVDATVEANPYSLSILGDTFGIVFAVSQEAVLSAVAGEVGVDRPAAQAEGESMPGIESVIAISTEVIGDHDADVVAVMSGVFYNESTILDTATYQGLSAVQAGNGVVVDGDMWFGTHPFAIYWILEDLESLALGQGADGIGTMDDITERWTGYLELVG
ncbi:MAG: ABC transporter substrate-binding protein [Actinomycetota bacterium]